MKITVKYAANVQVGDLVAGKIDRDAPTRPCQPFVAAMEVTAVEVLTPFPSHPRVKRYRYTYGTALLGYEYAAADQLVVIDDVKVGA